MRIGQNPARQGKLSYQPKRVGLLLLAYIPTRSGYFVDSLEVLRYQIASLHTYSDQIDLAVFDNGSCTEVRQELLRLQGFGWIDFLFISDHNVGKTGAINRMLTGLPNDVVGYADGDILFRPGWLEESLKILDSFPEAGLVTAQPCFFDSLKGNSRAFTQVAEHGQYQIGETMLPWQVKHEIAMSLNLDKKWMDGLRAQHSQTITHPANGVQALRNASHMQFIARRETISAILPLPATRALDPIEDQEINRRMDQAGYLPLSTSEPYVLHMANRLDDRLLEEVRSLGLDQLIESAPPIPRQLTTGSSRSKALAMRILDRLVCLPFMHNLILRLHNFLFDYLSR